MSCRIRLPWCAIIVVAAGCPTPKGPSSSAVAECGTWLCQTNAASLGNGLVFHELDASGSLYNDHGLRYVGFEDVNRVPLTLKIQGHEITATDAAGGYYAGQAPSTALLNATMVLETKAGERFDVRI